MEKEHVVLLKHKFRLNDNYMLPIANTGRDEAADIATSWDRNLKPLCK